MFRKTPTRGRGSRPKTAQADVPELGAIVVLGKQAEASMATENSEGPNEQDILSAMRYQLGGVPVFEASMQAEEKRTVAKLQQQLLPLLAGKLSPENVEAFCRAIVEQNFARRFLNPFGVVPLREDVGLQSLISGDLPAKIWDVVEETLEDASPSAAPGISL
jgi:hypothetical protein